MNKVSIDELIQLVTQEVVRQLKANGVAVTLDPSQPGRRLGHTCIQGRTERIDMGAYKTPILTEKQMNRLHELTGKIIVPQGTLITPKAREIAKRKQITIEMG